MATALLLATGCYSNKCNPDALPKKHETAKTIFGLSHFVLDVLATLSLILVGILGATGVISTLSFGASLGMIGAGVAIPTLFGLAFLVKRLQKTCSEDQRQFTRL